MNVYEVFKKSLVCYNTAFVRYIKTSDKTLEYIDASVYSTNRNMCMINQSKVDKGIILNMESNPGILSKIPLFERNSLITLLIKIRKDIHKKKKETNA